ncbi:hypothetical protein SJAV_14650 [Sulfurisphaera javensis]|uniref:Uncharacterized protein n=1 Tax=Sulfurisphaera javensis TaxID=2049879 RepID=A0AAT9GSC1_9CREN
MIQSYIRQYIQLEELYKYAYYTNYYSLLVEAIASKQLSEQYALQLEEEAKCLVTGNYDTYNHNEVLSQVNSCIEAQPNLPRNAKIMYEQQARQYLNGLMNYMNAKADEDELIGLLISDNE